MSHFRSIDDLRQKCGDSAADQAERKMRAGVNSELGNHVVRAVTTPARRKYRNEPVEHDGQRFDSKLERDAYLWLCREHEERNVIRQVSIPFGDNRLRVDFMVIIYAYPMGGEYRVTLYDAKGRVTPEWRGKANHLRDKHGITINLITREDLKT